MMNLINTRVYRDSIDKYDRINRLSESCRSCRVAISSHAIRPRTNRYRLNENSTRSTAVRRAIIFETLPGEVSRIFPNRLSWPDEPFFRVRPSRDAVIVRTRDVRKQLKIKRFTRSREY